MRVLIVEDEGDTAAALARGLRRQGLAVDVAGDGREALLKAALASYDVVVLDRDLPKVHGDEVCRRLNELDLPPAVLMLTAAGEVEDRVAGLAVGADDYLGKPFSFAELTAQFLRSGGVCTARALRFCASPTSSSTPRAGKRGEARGSCA